jgi:hypothetical protein
MESTTPPSVDLPVDAPGTRRGPWLVEAGPGMNDLLLDESLTIVAPRTPDPAVNGE